MSDENKSKDVIPFFTFQESAPSFLPKETTPTENVWIQKEKLMMAILDSIHDGVFTIDFNMNITSFNSAAERITGYTADEAIGKQCMDVFCNVGSMMKDCHEKCPMKKTIKYKTPITKKRTICNKKGEILTVSATTNILLDLNNNPIGGVEVFWDVTAFERLKEKWQGRKYNLGELVGKSAKMTEIYDMIESISGTLANVLIQGETGTGKGLIASTIHYQSTNRKGPFVHVNCAAMPESLLESELFGHVKGSFTGAVSNRRGRFKQAHKGTLFLDEIGELSTAMQAKLLRVVEEKKFERVGESKTTKVETRIISATNTNIEDAIKMKQFRQDLFFRLNTIPIKLPPLRERMEDIPLLVDHFMEKLNYKMDRTMNKFAPEIIDIFMRYSWPGNVRELESVLEYSFVQCDGDFLDISCLPPSFRMLSDKVTDISLSTQGISGKPFMLTDVEQEDGKTSEHKMLLKALKDCRWNRTKAAKQLNISRTTLWRMMKKYELG